MRHVYECPMRLADLDARGQVADAVYVDYLQEARVDMLRVHAGDRRADELAEGVVVVRHEVEHVAALVHRPAPVRIETWVTSVRAASFTLAYEVVDERPDGRVVYLRAATVLTPFVFTTERPRRITAAERAGLDRFRDEAGTTTPAPRVAPEDGAEWTERPVHVRWSDVDFYGHVNNVKYFDYFAEGRQALVSDGSGVRRCDVDYRRPILFRSDPYSCATTIVSATGQELVVVQEIRDAGEVLARAYVELGASG